MAWEVGVLLVWGGIVGLDLVSVPQIMVARPLVAGSVAGAVMGDVAAGVLVGVILELFALETLPVGAARYPDYGPAAVAATAAAVWTSGAVGLGIALVVGLIVAYGGEWSLVALRRRNSREVRLRATALDRGDYVALRTIHLRAIGRDALRAFALTAVGLLLALAARGWSPVSARGGVLLVAVTIGVGLASATVGTIRLSARPRGMGWFALGLGLGVVWVVVG